MRPSAAAPLLLPLALLIALLSLSAARGPRCLRLPELTRITRGTNAGANSGSRVFAYTAYLRSGRRRCSGSLVAPRWVLFAAHCSLRAGDHIDLVGRLRVARVRRVFRHPSYSRSRLALVHDIALAHLDRPLHISGHRPLRLNADPTFPPAGTHSRASGFGLGAARGAPGTLRFADVVALSNTQCATALARVPGFQAVAAAVRDDAHLCADEARCGAGVCNGDSGGPLVARASAGGVVQVGVTSYRIGECGTSGVPDVYTRVSSYRRWITAVTRGAVVFA